MDPVGKESSVRPPRVWARFLVLSIVIGGLIWGLGAFGLPLWLSIPTGVGGGIISVFALLALTDRGGCVPPPGPRDPDHPGDTP